TLAYNYLAPSGSGFGGGIAFRTNAAQFTFHNTIVARNTAGKNPDISATSGTPAIVSQGRNLIGAADGVTGWGNDFYGSANSPRDPHFSLPAERGGFTPTIGLQPDSDAVDGGDDGVLKSPLLLTTDQRGEGF